MAIVSFWNDIRGETGKTSSMVAISTYLAINSNYRILMFNTKYNDTTMEECFWPLTKRNLYDTKGVIDIETGIRGLYKAISSNKTSPEVITNYTKTVFKDRLEILTDRDILIEKYLEQRKKFREIVSIANRYYDLVLVDLDSSIDDETTRGIIEISDVVVVTLSQRIRQIEQYVELKKRNRLLGQGNVAVLLGKYDEKSKYNRKNLMRYIHTSTVYALPYNTLFFEACSEGKVDDFFIKFRKTDKQDPNSSFVKDVKNISDELIEFIQQAQIKK